MAPNATKATLLYPELSYQIVGLLYDVYNELGYGLKERQYQRAMAAALRKEDISFEEQLHMPLYYREEKVGNLYLDFLIEKKIILELKRGTTFSKKNIDQVYEYLKAYGMQLGIIAQFTPDGVKCKRIVNLD